MTDPTLGVGEVAARAPRLETDTFQRGQQFMRWRVADVLRGEHPDLAALVEKLPLLGDDEERRLSEALDEAVRVTKPLRDKELEAERLPSGFMDMRLREAARAPREPLEPPPDHRECQNCGRITYEEQEEFCGWCGKLITVAAARSALPPPEGRIVDGRVIGNPNPQSRYRVIRLPDAAPLPERDAIPSERVTESSDAVKAADTGPVPRTADDSDRVAGSSPTGSRSGTSAALPRVPEPDRTVLIAIMNALDVHMPPDGATLLTELREIAATVGYPWSGGACEMPPLEALTEAERDVPLEVRRELMACAAGNGRISYHWLCQLYTRGRAERDLYRGTLVGLLPVCDATPGPLADQIKRFINQALRAARAGAEAPTKESA